MVSDNRTDQAIKVWSEQQDKIFNWFGNSLIDGIESKHLIVEAYAGTGKTTTILRAIDFAPERRIVLCAFNKRIEQELSLRLRNPNAQAKTLHALGFACVRRYRDNLKVSDKRAENLAEKVCGASAPDDLKKLVKKLHTLGREMNPTAQQHEDLIDIAVNFECEPDEKWQATQFNTAWVVAKSLEAMELASQVQRGGEIDFADMIFLPVRNRWLSKQFDMVVVDEAQDMTTAQLAIAEGICDGRIAIVGDPNQAIYGFRGADSGSLGRLQTKLNAGKLGLTTTYRCGRVIVTAAQQFVADFEAGPNNPEGEILAIPTQKLQSEVQPGDFILSRVNAPLVSTAMSLLKNGKRARIAGRDIGTGLKMLLRKLSKGEAAYSVEKFLERVVAWEEAEILRARAAKKEARVSMVQDQAEMLQGLAEDVQSVREIENRIDALFTDDGLGQAGVITCSSVHRAKGLEADRVFILKDTLKNFNQEEMNIQYVAVTRAKKTLVWVKGS
jgi:superfamily I DNA/RNA helicase